MSTSSARCTISQAWSSWPRRSPAPAGGGSKPPRPGRCARREERRMSDTEAILGEAASWRRDGKGVALATVIATWGSSPRPVGSKLAVDDAGRMTGSVSGGCVEGAVVETALDVIRDGAPQLLEFGVSDEQAWAVGLACGGRVRIFVERLS